MPAGGAIVYSLKDAITVVVEIFESAKREIVFIEPPSVFSIAGASYNTVQNAKRFIQNGGVIRGITTISRAKPKRREYDWISAKTCAIVTFTMNSL